MARNTRAASNKSKIENYKLQDAEICGCAVKPEDSHSEHRDFYAKEARQKSTNKKVKLEAASMQSVALLSGIRAKKWLGAHLSASGGPQNAINNARQVGAIAFALFMKSQRRWDNPPILASTISSFIESGQQHGFIPEKAIAPVAIPVSQRVLPHGSYLINLANPDAEKRQKSYENFVDDLKRCEACHIGLYNFHPGSTLGSCSEQEGIQSIADAINKAHEETSFVTIVLENMVIILACFSAFVS
jgi:AP endonuclease 1